MKNNQKGFANLVLIGAIFLIVAVGGYFAWSKKSNNINTIPQPQADTSNWKTYTNTQYGFEFKYPESYSYETRNGDLFQNSLQINVKDSNHTGFSLFVNQTASGYADGCTNIKESTVIINNLSMKKLDTCGLLSYTFESGSDKFIFVVLKFSDPLMNQVLPTFKFIEPNQAQGIVIEEPVANQKVKLPIVVKGYINGSGWTAFEGVAGSVEILDANGSSVGFTQVLPATTEWTTLPVHFETKVGDAYTMNNTKTDTGYLLFRSENPKDNSSAKEFRLPIKFTK